jgi:hypothetical protein
MHFARSPAFRQLSSMEIIGAFDTIVVALHGV